ncbi:hypothetical protein [Blastococcus sp. PRF04-17]|uniref:hypothetical protein n=1 Tax=Blastococcus sp. PRF04-17 TaxID=2933797 RepID=UPI001FF377AE|nr:hypothetical protein [Blastococcus sp. PRF04-17]UOY03313.1 hypothetical protein MVA48_08210 [Blastococcus sp. PRF04-17]
MVALCLGPACAAALRPTRAGALPVRDAVRGSRGAVLVTTACLGRCTAAAVAVVAHRDGGGRSSGATVWLSGVHEPSRAEALAVWVRDGGPAAEGQPDSTLPASLVPAAAGLGPPMRMQSPT